MNNLLLIFAILVVMSAAYQFGLRRTRAVSATGETTVRMHSRPGFYGMYVALWCGIPAFVIVFVWQVLQPLVIDWLVMGQLPAEVLALPADQLGLVVNRIQNLAGGVTITGEVQPYETAAAQQIASMRSIGFWAMVVVSLAIAIVGLLYAQRRVAPQLRARNAVEHTIKILLIICSAVAILTTVGIVLSMLGQAIAFFSYVSPLEFFFGTEWSPRFSTTDGDTNYGEFGMLPLLWGTIMIGIIAMLVAVPVGLMSAIYLSEYAPPRLRSFAKPILEILAGIPTIVYGFFALTVVGPSLHEFGGWFGLEVGTTSALTAGVVMGIMIIPFVSSLSDDIITQVPRAMRDGSLGLGATRSETMRRVIFPAALPGIVGAILLAVSRAIGETMIVVLAAGNSPVLTANPFEAVSTITVTIVNQLTGDSDFASPQSLVAFALGLTLFVITLGLNVVALYIVRKYREQYE